MQSVMLAHAADFDGWRAQARRLLLQEVPPDQLVWQFPGHSADLFGDTPAAPPDRQVADLPAVRHAVRETVDTCRPAPAAGRGGQTGTAAASSVAATVPVQSGSGQPVRAPLRVSRDFLDLACRVACHRDPARFALLYRLLWRQAQGERHLLQNVCDDDVYRAGRLAKAVGRDVHKMRAFLRFRRSRLAEADHYHAWFEPEHHILRFNCGFFQRRFAAMHWSIATPDGSAHWNGTELRFGPAVERGSLPDSEPMEALWRTYFASIFNPARLRLDAMRSEMPMKYWKNLPEAAIIAPLVQQAGSRSHDMLQAPPTKAPRFAARALHGGSGARSDDPPGRLPTVVSDGLPLEQSLQSLAELAQAVRGCDRCPHACRATQAVPGAGRAGSALMLVGEQPGDQEDLAGRPFVGPAGELLRELLAETDCDADSLYLTNAVKHFRYSVRGKLRLHQRPGEDTIAACQPWLRREIELVSPRVVLALGATAARALLGRPVQVSASRGQWLPVSPDCQLLITCHPAFVLRQRSAAERQQARDWLRSDLRLAIGQAFAAGRPQPEASRQDAGCDAVPEMAFLRAARDQPA